MKNNKKNLGFSLSETLIAMLIGIFLLTGVLLLWNSVKKAWHIERIHSKLICELETFVERFKQEISASDANGMFFYPEGDVTYQAISFPLAVDDDGDGFVEVDNDKNIIWDQTVIYHVYETEEGQTQLRQTVFNPRIDMSKEDRQQQINEVVTNGKAIGTTPNYINSSTRFLFTCSSDVSPSPVTLKIEPSAQEFDGYRSSVDRTEEISFGNITLTAGEHYISFTISGTSNDDYELGIDSFTISPSGGTREAEECDIYGDSGKNILNEDMSGYGSWSGNRQLEYQANEEGDFISLSFYYDEWIETNFHRCSPSNTLIGYNDADGDGGVTGTSDYVVKLDGNDETWDVNEQVGGSTPETALDIAAPATGRNYRNIISHQVTDTEGSAIRFQFRNCSSINSLNIESATLFERSGGSDGVASTKKMITFSGNNYVTISPGGSLWSDWINLADIGNFNKDVDYLVSFFVNGSSPIGMSYWPASEGSLNSYVIESDTNYSEEADWSSAVENISIFALKAVEVSYFSYGSLTSQVYDTGLASPDYSTLSWAIAKNNYGNYESGGLGANLIIKVRSSDNKDALLSDNDWSDELSIDTLSETTGSADISSLSGGRYVQFQAEFYSQAEPGGYNYIKTCVLKNVKIRWPGESTPEGVTIVNIGGYFTRKPQYGKFFVSIDGHTLTKGLEMTLKLTKEVYGLPPVTRSVTTEIEPRNTGR